MKHDGEVTLEGPLPAWGDGILRARWQGSPAAAILGPPSVDPAALALAKQRASNWVRRGPPGVLPLWEVTRARGREAWIYARPSGLSCAVLCARSGGLPPAPVALELVARTAEVLLSLGDAGARHPGPHLSDVLVDEHGTVQVAGFVRPDPAPPAETPDAKSIVGRIGQLLATLLTGRRPPSTEATEHAYHGEVRADLLARSGPPLPDGVEEAVLELLVWDPERQPPLSSVPSRLRRVARADLATWAADALPGIRRRLEASWEMPEDERAHTLLPGDAEEITEESDLSYVMSDVLEEVTAASGGRGDWPRDVPEHGAIPVLVGPPPEAVSGPLSLPSDLFDRDGATQTLPRARGRAGLVGISIVLTLLAAALGAYVLAG